MRATLLFALLSYTRAYQLPRSRRSLVVPPRRYDLQPRSAPTRRQTPTRRGGARRAAPACPARYDVTKLVDSSEGRDLTNLIRCSRPRAVCRRFGLAGGLAIFGICPSWRATRSSRLGTRCPSPPTRSDAALASNTPRARGPRGRRREPARLGDGPAIRVSIGDKVIFDSTADAAVAFKLGQRPFRVLCEG